MDGDQDIADPYGGSVEVYRETYEEIKDAIDTIVEKVKREFITQVRRKKGARETTL